MFRAAGLEATKDWGGGVAILTQRVGARLRSIRQQKGLSLHEVEAMSDEEFKASVLGAYERSERVISVPRLIRLAQVYGVPAEQLLPKGVEVDLTEPAAADLSEGFAVDLSRLQECREPEALALARLVAVIQAQRQDFNGRVLSIRANDLRALAYFLLSKPEDLCGRLTGLALQALPA
jgi:transcriptional regulator with XRE-family HTH domain